MLAIIYQGVVNRPCLCKVWCGDLTDAAGISVAGAPDSVFYAPGFGVLASALQPLHIANATGRAG